MLPYFVNFFNSRKTGPKKQKPVIATGSGDKKIMSWLMVVRLPGRNAIGVLPLFSPGNIRVNGENMPPFLQIQYQALWQRTKRKYVLGDKHLAITLETGLIDRSLAARTMRKRMAAFGTMVFFKRRAAKLAIINRLVRIPDLTANHQFPSFD